MGPPQCPLASCKPQWHQITWHSRSLIKFGPLPSTPAQPSLANQQARLPGTLQLCSSCLFRRQQSVPESDLSSTGPPPFSPLLTGSMLVTQSCLTLCDPTDCSPPGTSAHGIPHERILEWVTIPFSRGSSEPRDQT